MIAIILAGGLGSRLADETSRKPKPMVEIGGRPILWHIMNICRLLVLHGHAREEDMLEARWAWGDAPWKTWDDTAPVALAR